MAKNTPQDFSQVAAAFLDLWQKQLVASFNDPAVVGAMLETLRATGNMQNFGAKGYETFFNKPQSARHTAAGVPAGRDDYIRELEGRVAALEQRIAELESSPKKRSSAAPKKPAKKRK